MPGDADDEAIIEYESLHMEYCMKENEDVIAREMKSVVTELVVNKLKKTVGEPLDDVLHRTFHTAPSGFRSVVFNIVKEAILDVILKYIIAETLDARIAKFSTRMKLERDCSRGLCSQIVLWHILRLLLSEKRI